MVENAGEKQGKNMPFCPVLSTGLEIQVLGKKFAAGHKLPSVQACTSLDLNLKPNGLLKLSGAVEQLHSKSCFQAAQAAMLKR